MALSRICRIVLCLEALCIVHLLRACSTCCFCFLARSPCHSSSAAETHGWNSPTPLWNSIYLQYVVIHPHLVEGMSFRNLVLHSLVSAYSNSLAYNTNSSNLIATAQPLTVPSLCRSLLVYWTTNLYSETESLDWSTHTTLSASDYWVTIDRMAQESDQKTYSCPSEYFDLKCCCESRYRSFSHLILSRLPPAKTMNC